MASLSLRGIHYHLVYRYFNEINMSTNQQRERWEERFDEVIEYGTIGASARVAIKYFIKETLATERENLLGEIRNGITGINIPQDNTDQELYQLRYRYKVLAFINNLKK